MIEYVFDAFPPELKEYKQYVCWKYEENTSDPDKPKKPPIDPNTGHKASPTNPASWGSFEDAVKCYGEGGVDGIGIVLTEDLGVTVIDIDDCRSAKSGRLNPYAKKIMEKFPSYTEVSPSGEGVHIFVYGRLPGKGINTGQVEVYDRKHYMTITGHHVDGTPKSVKRWHNRLQEWHATLPQPAKKEVILSTTSEPDDLGLAEILSKLFLGEKNGKLARLWSGDIAGYKSQSEADKALCSLLSAYTQSPKTIDSLFRLSKLMRLKWDQSLGKGTYGSLTITKVLKNPHTPIGNSLNEKSTEYEIATAVIKRIGRSNLYCLAKQNWLWSKSEGVWRVVDDAEIKKIIHKTAHVKSVTSGRVNSVFGLITTEVYSTVSRFGKCDRHVINCKNGELHYENNAWEVKEHRRDSNFCHQIPIMFDVDAICERFKQFLDEIFEPDEDKKQKIRLVQEFFGYSLITSCEFERFLLLVGAGNNGKSVLLKVIMALVGEKCVSSVQTNQFEHPPALAHLHGKLLNVVTEIPVGAVIADAKLKSITSGELTNAAHKFGHPFDFIPYCTLMFSANHLPHTKDCSPAFFRRAEVLAFNRIFKKEECDTGLADKLIQEELPGILNFALQGLKRLYKNGFTDVPSSKATKREWELSADQVAAFIDEECELDPSAKIPIGDLYRKYKDWADDSGIKSNVNKNNLTSRLKRMGCTATRNGSARMLLGVKLKYE